MRLQSGKFLSREELAKDLNISPDATDSPLLLDVLKRNHQPKVMLYLIS